MDFQELRLNLIKESKEKIKASINDDNLVSQAISSIHEIDKAVNILSKRLREWYELYNPELSHKIHDHDVFVKKVLEKPIKEELSMGADLEDFDLNQILSLATIINSMVDEKTKLVDYIKTKMKICCPNLLELAGPLIGGKLLAHKGHLRDLAFMPSSTIQLLGAEKALFRHLKTHSRSPKYGYILQHQDVSSAKNKGQAARQLANKISLAVKKDYFSRDLNND